ncbi:type II toxin-antitoxin system Phd/YefM family antitoxin [Sedimenticola hydrogenitrophicus]|uniref:type II toxin-antitoxin system Phd/YefM family antitoxin n=1 Tax=Sedimenticola hydrogenitrophicus TaxID=2967975 RepID=UPI0021A73B06|nr:type II toxin-antitoxin system prevent-host-death family antitoxin [Sedimenticola hydrogenitrophicus]
MHKVNMHEAKSQLSALVEEALAGGDVVIARAGKPLARLVPYKEHHEERKPGRWKGKLWVADDFDVTPEELLSAFERDS